jgi:uncharacterized protein YbjT (DUF2867 family)
MILITGAGGKTGRAIIRALLKNGVVTFIMAQPPFGILAEID